MSNEVVDPLKYLNDDDHQNGEEPSFMKLLEVLEKEVDANLFRPKINSRFITKHLGAAFFATICQEVERIVKMQIQHRASSKIAKKNSIKFKSKSDLEKAIKEDVAKMFGKNKFKTIDSRLEAELIDHIETIIMNEYEAVEEVHSLLGFRNDRIKKSSDKRKVGISLFKIFFYLAFKPVYETNSLIFQKSAIYKEKDAFCEYLIDRIVDALEVINESANNLGFHDLLESIEEYQYKGKDIYIQIKKEIKDKKIVIRNNMVRVAIP